jgi:hypothetical protein
MLKNSAIQKMLGLELPSLTCEMAIQRRIFQFVSQHDFGDGSFGEKIDQIYTTLQSGDKHKMYSLFELL